MMTIIETARKDPEFALVLREHILKVIPNRYHKEADKWIHRVLNINAKVIPYDRARAYRSSYKRDQKPKKDSD